MHPAYFLYTLAGALLFALLFPVFWVYTRLTGKHRYGLQQRLGRYPSKVEFPAGSPRIWIHAASVGEVRVAEAVIEQFHSTMPGCAIVLSTVTASGHAVALDVLGAEVSCIIAPLDFVFSIRRALAAIAPDIFVCLETEIWPHLFIQTKRAGAITAVLNGRISQRTRQRYRVIKPLIAETLRHVDIFSMISRSNADRIISLGAPAARVHVNGNAKYHFLAGLEKPEVRDRLRRLFHLEEGQPVLVAGSTRKDEDSIIIDAYKALRPEFPDMVLILAPRHVEKAPVILNLLREQGIAAELKSRMDESGSRRRCPVVVVDTMGELQNIYSVSSVAFCGGSLVPTGGHNLLEPAAWGVPVLYGPHVDDVIDARDALEQTGGGMCVTSGEALIKAAEDLFRHPEKAKAMGRAAGKAVSLNADAAKSHVALVRDLFEASREKRR